MKNKILTKPDRFLSSLFITWSSNKVHQIPLKKIRLNHTFGWQALSGFLSSFFFHSLIDPDCFCICSVSISGYLGEQDVA